MTDRAEQDPQRLHPGSILLRILSDLPRTLLGIPAMLALFRDRGSLVLAAFIVLIFLASIAYSYLRWRRFSYQVGPDAIVIADGVIRRSRRSIPLDRVQDISVEQKPLARLFGLASIRIETGGGEADDGRLDSVSLAEAGRLRALVRRSGSEQAAAPASTAEATPVEHAVFTMTWARVLTLGLFRFSLVWIAVIFGALNMLEDLVGFDYDQLKAWYRTGTAQGMRYLNLWSLFGIAALAVLLGLASGIIRTVLAQHGFRLTALDGRLRRVRGLLTRSEVVITVTRVQLALIETSLFSGRFGWRGLKLQTLGGSDDAGGRQEVAPLARQSELHPVLAAAGLPMFEPDQLRPVTSAHIVRTLIRLAPLPLAIGLGAILLPQVWVGLAVVPPLVVRALLVRRHHRFALLPHSFQLTRGVLSRRSWIIPYRAVQVVRVRQGPIQRLLGVATVDVDTAGAGQLVTPRVIDVKASEAMRIAGELIARRPISG